MALNIGKVKQYDEKRPNLVADYDEMYRELKVRYDPYIKMGKVGFDDRTKLFHFAIADSWHEWMLLSYNQNRMTIGSGLGCVHGGGQSIGGSYPSYPDQGNLSWQLSSIQTSLSQLTHKLSVLEGRINYLESKQPG